MVATEVQKAPKQTFAQTPTERKARQSVLVVDDDESLRRVTQLILSTAYDVKTAPNGHEALRIMEREEIDVIVLDLRMPVLDGPGFFHALRARGHTTPVLVVSSYDAQDARKKLGAEAGLEKPFEPGRLLRMVGNMVTRRQ